MVSANVVQPHKSITRWRASRRTLKDDPSVQQAIADQSPRITEALGLSEDAALPKRPTIVELFDRHLSSEMWPMLSQMGSHPGFQQLFLFFLDVPARSGYPMERSGRSNG
jgi:hypothetical protein